MSKPFCPTERFCFFWERDRHAHSNNKYFRSKIEKRFVSKARRQFNKKLCRLAMFSIFMFFAGCAYSYAQKIEVEQSFIDSSAKAFAEVIADRAAIEALKNEIESRKQLESLNEQLISKQKELLLNQDLLIKQYEKSRGTTLSFFFGLIKFRKQ